MGNFVKTSLLVILIKRERERVSEREEKKGASDRSKLTEVCKIQCHFRKD